MYLKFDSATAPTVQEYVRNNHISKIWVCPSKVSNGKIANPDYLRGIECTASTIPEQVRTKLVRTTFRDNGFECIIWENDEDVDFLDINPEFYIQNYRYDIKLEANLVNSMLGGGQ